MAPMASSDPEAITYKRGLDTVEAQLVTYRKNEVLFSEEVVVLKREVGIKQYEINKLQTEFEKLKQEKDGIEFKMENFVPPPHPLIYNRPNKLDLSYSGLEEFQQPEFEVYGLRANKSVCENSSNETKKISDAPLIEEWVSDNEDEVESPVMVEKKIVDPTIPKVDVVRPKQQEKPVRKTVRYAEMYRSKGHRGNQRNWNNLKSQQLGSDFVMNNKACFNDSLQSKKKYDSTSCFDEVWNKSSIITAQAKGSHNAVKRIDLNTVFKATPVGLDAKEQ
ncbi:hypothetical protein Tco_1108519 [Tanacetum coccineum]